LSDQDMISLQKQLIDDAKGAYRFKQIEEEGNDPALSFLNKDEKEGGSGGEASAGGSSGGELPTAEPSGGEEKGDKGKESKKTPGEAGGAGGLPKLSEKRDQTGRKDARDHKYAFGEDPLGTLENNRKADLSVSHKYRKGSALSLEAIRGLTDVLKTLDQEKEILREGNQKSFMDEQNIKE
jgi:hypothetical protein